MNWWEVLKAEMANPIILPNVNPPPTITGGGPSDCSKWFERVFKVFENHKPDYTLQWSEDPSKWVRPDIKKLKAINKHLCDFQNRLQEKPWYEFYKESGIVPTGEKITCSLLLGKALISVGGRKRGYGTQAFFFLEYDGEVLINIDFLLPDFEHWEGLESERYSSNTTTQEERDREFERKERLRQDTNVVVDSMRRELNGLGIEILEKDRSFPV